MGDFFFERREMGDGLVDRWMNRPGPAMGHWAGFVFWCLLLLLHLG